MAKRKRPPMQPIVFAEDGVIRFQKNVLVEYLLDAAGKFGLDMNHLAIIPCPRSDREQFAQLIGYSVSGFGELSYARNKTVARADAKSAIVWKNKGR